MSSAWSLVSPALCVALLGGLMVEKQTRVRAEDAEPFHAKAKAAIASIPYQLGGWCGQDDEVPPAASQLLRPNIILSRTYVDPTRMDRRASLLIVQCKDSRDMLGHFPPVCYPAHGMTLAAKAARDWQIGDLLITGTEYEFLQVSHERDLKMAVRNFMVVPGSGIKRDMDGVLASAADHQARYFGAAQFQVTFSADYTPAQRDEVFAKLIGPIVPVIQTLRSGGLQ